MAYSGNTILKETTQGSLYAHNNDIDLDDNDDGNFADDDDHYDKDDDENNDDDDDKNDNDDRYGICVQLICH